MATYPVDDNAVMEVTVFATLWAQRIMIVRHYQQSPDFSTGISDGIGALGDVITFHDSDASGICKTWAVYATSELKLDRVRAQWIAPTRYAYRERVSTVLEGTKAPPTLPQNLAGVVTLQSERAGRHGRGNVHVAGLELDQSVDGKLTNVAQSHLSVIGDACSVQISLASAPGVRLDSIIYNRAAPLTYTPITHNTPQDTVRVMRRRTVRLGQ